MKEAEQEALASVFLTALGVYGFLSERSSSSAIEILVARASSPCFGQAGSLSYHFLAGSRITDFVRQIS